MEAEIQAMLVEYADAQKHANGGCEGHWATVNDCMGQPCTPHMARYHNAQYAILALEGRQGLPEPIRAFLEAEGDKGCDSCWLSSHRKQHQECDDKIHRWFDTREALIELGLSLAKGH